MAAHAIPSRAKPGSERRFFAGMALVILCATLVGFAPSFYLRGLIPAPHPYEPLRPYVLLHGLLFSAWIILFVAQTALVSAGRTDLHRRLGLTGMWLVAAMIPMALMVGILGVGRPLTAARGIDPLSWLAVPLLDVPVFAGLIVAALVKRRDPQTHKRLMLIAMVDMMRPSLGRLLPLLGVHGPGPLILPLLMLLPLVVFDLRTGGRIHRATQAGSLVVAGVVILTLAIWQTSPWLGFARLVSAPFI